MEHFLFYTLYTVYGEICPLVLLELHPNYAWLSQKTTQKIGFGCPLCGGRDKYV